MSEEIRLPIQIQQYVPIPNQPGILISDEDAIEALKFCRNVSRLNKSGIISELDQLEAQIYLQSVLMKKLEFSLTQEHLEMKKKIQNIQESIQQNFDEIKEMISYGEERKRCRNYNTKLQKNEILKALPDNNGNFPQHFPRTFDNIFGMSEHQISSVLTFYDIIPFDSFEKNKNQLLKFISK